MAVIGSWVGLGFVAGSFLSGASALGLIAYLLRYRGRPGANWFVGALGFVSLSCLTYGAALLVFDPELRELLEAVFWLGLLWTGPFFFGFGLEYTGRGDLLRSLPFKTLFLVPAGATLALVTFPYHDLLWSEFEQGSTFSISTAQYTIEPVGSAVVVFGLVLTFLGVLLLVETVVSYGPLYRREAIAVVASTVSPVVGVVLWLSGRGPYPELNVVPVLFLPHVVLDAYAFVGTNMFEGNPTTMRAAERTAIDDLPNPIVILDSEGTVVEHNAAAETLFENPDSAVGCHLSAHLEVERDDSGLPRDGVDMELQRAKRQPRTYTVSTSPLVEPAGRTVGRTVVFQDVTDQREREQQLNVLNRVLRHNLRSELTVINGTAEMISAAVDDPDVAERVDQLQASGRALTDIVQRAREFERIRDRDPAFERVDVEGALDAVVDDVRSGFPDATIDLRDVDGAILRTDPAFLTIVLTNLLSNAVEHSERRSPTAGVAARLDGPRYLIEIDDDGPGIPEEELAVLDRGIESALEHGSGLGLWIATWAADRIGAELRFDSNGGGTVATVSLPIEDDRSATSNRAPGATTVDEPSSRDGPSNPPQ